jgi:hypothetical protein
MKFKKGMEVKLYLRGAGYTISFDDNFIVLKVSKGKVYTNESDVPYNAETGMWEDNGVMFGFTRWIEPLC